MGVQAGLIRCPWGDGEPLLQAYHDAEWGVPRHDDRTLFEFLVLEGAQAGLSWRTVLAKRDRYREVFANFDVATVAAFGEDDVARLLEDPGIIRNRAKVRSAVTNARAAMELTDGLAALLWSFVDGRPVQNRWQQMAEVPATTVASDRMSKELKRRRFGFVGSTICYSLMQACGLVNDHLVECYRHAQVRYQGA
jgi:DNA-3-methyladenine glycosylase I